jgi:hypothetical protein
MSHSAQSKPAETPKKGAVLPPSRIVVIVLVLATVILVPIQLRAKSAYDRSRKAFDAAMAAAEKKGEGLYKKDVDQYLQGSPSRSPVGKDGELFTWKGLLPISYHMQLEYAEGGFVRSAKWSSKSILGESN